MWKVLIVSIYFLFQTLGILTVIIRSPFMAPVRKNKFIYTDFIFNREIRHHYSVHVNQTQGWRLSSSVSAGAGQWMREENTRRGGDGVQWAVSPSSHVMLIGAQTHSDAAAERGVLGSDVTKWDRASLSPHKSAVSHCERKESGPSSGQSCKHSHSPQLPTSSHVPLKDPCCPMCPLCPNPPSVYTL